MKNILEFDSLTLSFGEHKILSSIYMQCQQGEVVGLLGRNGSGKSSLMKVVFGTLEAEHTSVRVNGVSMHGNHDHKRIIGFLPQDKLIPSYVSLRTAFRLFKIDTDEIVSDAPVIKDFFNFKSYELSGGSLRLIEALLILYSPAPFCILDEPFTGLMPLHIETLKSIITKSKDKKGIIISDHMHQHVTDLSDRLYLLTNGKTYEIKESEQLVGLGYLNSL